MLNFKDLLLAKLKGKISPEIKKQEIPKVDGMVSMSAEAVRNLNKTFKPNIYTILRSLATGKHKSQGRSGFPYKDHSNSDKRKARRLRQIEKGIIQVSPDYQPKPKQEEVNERHSEMVRQ